MKIIFLNGDNAGTKVELAPAGLTIGRETDNHLQLPVGGVSRYHARIEFVDDEYLLRDLLHWPTTQQGSARFLSAPSAPAHATHYWR